MKKLLILVAVGLALLLGLAASGWWWLTTTQSGAHWLLNRASTVAPSLTWERLEGDFRGGLVLHGLHVEEAGVRADIDRLELAVRIHLPPGAKVDVHWLRLFDGDLRLPPGGETPEATQPLALPDLRSPVPVRIREAALHQLRIHPHNADEPIRIERIALAARAKQELQLQQLDVQLPGLTASASGRWGLSEPFAGELELEADYRLDDEITQAAAVTVRGDLSRLSVDVETRGPARLAGQLALYTPLDEPRVELNLDGRLGDWPGLDLAIDDLTVSGQGELQDWQLDLAGQVSGADIPANRWQFALAGDLEQIAVRRGRVELFDGRVDVDGDISLADGPRAQLRLVAEALDLGPLHPEWPADARLAGGFELDADPNRVEIRQLQLTAAPTSLAVEGSGHWSADSDELDVDLQWRDLNWPPQADALEPLFQSESGSLRLRGQLTDWRLELDALLRLLDQPDLALDIQARGDLESAEITRLLADAGDAGRAQAGGQVRWLPEPGGQLALSLSNVDVGRFSDVLSGRISAELDLDADSPESMVFDLRRLDGELREQPVSGEGRVSLRRDSPEAGRLDLRFGDNRIGLSSDDGNEWQLDLDAEALHQLVPQASGRLVLDAQLNLQDGTGKAAATLSEAGWDNLVLERGRLESHFDWLAERPAAELELHLDDLDLNPWERIEQLELSLEGHCDDHRARLTLTGQRGSLDLGAGGRLDSCTLREVKSWSGAIEQLFLGNTVAGDWELNQPLELELAGDRVRASRGCLVESAERSGRICLRSLDVADTGQIEIGIEEVPMDLLLVPLDPVFHLTTPLSGELSAGWSEDFGLERMAGHLALGAGVLQPVGGDDSLLGIESVRLDFTPEPERLLVDLDALLEGDSRLSGQAQLIDLNDLSSATVEALARLNLPDIGIFNRLVTELDQLGGQLTGEMQLSGALLGPGLDGRLQLEQGLIVHAPLGLRIEDINVALEGTETSASLSGRMRGGEGELSVDGALELIENQWQLDTAVSGERFAFTDVDWLRLQASPDIRLQRSGDGLLSLDGDVRVDHLRAGMPPGAEQRVNASADVQVRGETDEDEESPDLGRQLKGRLGLELGNDARLSALGMQASLAGGLELVWDRDSIEPRARGVIRIPEGSYRAYGQNLEIDDGEIVFTGHAIDNPSLDVEAVREIFGDPQVEAAGVRIRGNARDPRITLFTEPPTSEEKALAYVVTGANFDHASGQAAISLGFYLLPRLFVSYGIGLFEAGNVLSGRYELSQRWGVRVVSGERDTGVDLSYAVDR